MPAEKASTSFTMSRKQTGDNPQFRSYVTMASFPGRVGVANI